MTLLQEAGFHPLEAIRAATLHGAEALHEPKGLELEFGIVRARGDAGGFGARRSEPVAEPDGALRHATSAAQRHHRPQPRVGGVRYTIKDGIVYDAKQLLADVAAMVEAQKRGTTSQ
jgi:hypothetical protein